MWVSYKVVNAMWVQVVVQSFQSFFFPSHIHILHTASAYVIKFWNGRASRELRWNMAHGAPLFQYTISMSDCSVGTEAAVARKG